jgi:hypothetical protein
MMGAGFPVMAWGELVYFMIIGAWGVRGKTMLVKAVRGTVFERSLAKR